MQSNWQSATSVRPSNPADAIPQWHQNSTDTFANRQCKPSAVIAFTIAHGVPDTRPPWGQVRYVPPPNPCRGILPLRIMAWDDVSIEEIHILVDEVIVAHIDAPGTSEEILYELATDALATGSHVATIDVVDSAGNVARIGSIPFTSDAAAADTQCPLFTFAIQGNVILDSWLGTSSASLDQPLTGTVSVGLHAWDNVSIAGARISLDGMDIVDAVDEGNGIPFPVECDLDTSAYSDRRHTLTVSLIDSAGNECVDGVVTAIFANDASPPEVVIDTPFIDPTSPFTGNIAVRGTSGVNVSGQTLSFSTFCRF